jgi:NAD(P)-dependent dehydrogenase (short-subunit alcohol dehydrogenase family)
MSQENGVPTFTNLLSLEGQRALVTGGSGNIGRGIALRLAEAGADVVVHYQADVDGATDTVAGVREFGRDAAALRADLGIADEVAALFEKLDGDGAPISCVVNNAGIYPVKEFAEMTAAEWREVIAANLDSAAHVSQEAIRRWCDKNVKGAIVNITSIESTDPAPGHSHYATSKAGLLMLTRSLTLEYGRRGIRVNAVSPGLITADGIEEDWPEGVASWHENAPLERMGDPMDVADAVLFLLAPASRWISGANLLVDGGISCASRW